MNAHNAAQDLANAQAKLARARQQLRRLQQAAMEGCYDEVALDDAVITYRQARLDARAARLAWSETRDTGLEQPVEEPTPRMLFARWLVQTGRLSEWCPTT